MRLFGKYFLLSFLLLGTLRSVYAAPLPEFDAVYKIKVSFFTIGQAFQSLHCQAEICTLTNTAAPPDWAKAYVNETVKETVLLQQTQNALTWQQYHKYLTREVNGKTKQIETHLQRQANQVVLNKGEKTWPFTSLVFDAISLPYAIQYARLNNLAFNQFIIQDDKSQTPLIYDSGFVSKKIDLPIGDNIQTERFRFHNDKIDAQLWLAPKWQYLPVKMVLTNKEKDRVITLELENLKQTQKSPL